MRTLHNHRPRLLLSLLLCVGLALPAVAAGDDAPPDPWQTLDGLRRALVDAGPTGYDFVQTYVPAGFSSGESEGGTVALALPGCLRWDYAEPYAKSFLLCGDTAWAWNRGETSGRRQMVDREEEPGLDLLLLAVDELRQRYEARGERGDDGTLLVHLQPLEPLETLSDATLRLAPDGERLLSLSYRDREGNATRFRLSDPRPLDGTGDRFEPPEDVVWQQ